MAYTASALSFLLQNLKKPVILTGAQLPIDTLRTDEKDLTVETALTKTMLVLGLDIDREEKEILLQRSTCGEMSE